MNFMNKKEETLEKLSSMSLKEEVTEVNMNQNKKMKQLLCYICCAEYGTTSLAIHQRVCGKQHKW